ncbi:hypothetical protein Acr_00g0062160 [Actinidia rufa]|uniref:Uncharacterized protein n=1 Tax=Actinidia rufa TaxID=165716 RepID=A0A7J0DP44_9ERIC|nr:hypothetical protein Acr_00g0062160 [Actinidia rufa]
MADEVAQLSSSPKDNPPGPEGSPSISVPPMIERENNIMTQGELERFRESYSIPSNVQIRLPEANKTIAPTRPGEVAFFEATFHTGDNDEDISVGGAAPVASDEGESHHSRDEPRQGDHSQDGSATRGKVQPIISGLELGGSSSSSSSRSEAWLDPRLPSSSDQTKIILKKFAQMVEGCKWSSPAAKSTPAKGVHGSVRFELNQTKPMRTGWFGSRFFRVFCAPLTPAAKGVVVGEKCPKEEVPDILPSKDLNGKGAMPLPEAKQKAKSKATSSVAVSKGAKSVAAPREGTSAKPGDILGPNASMMENLAVAEKLLEGLIPPFDRKEVVVLASSFIGQGRELRDGAMIQYARAESVGTEMARAQQRATKLEGLMVELSVWEQRATEELKKMKEEWDATVEAVEFTASRYFDEGFDFYKRQISHFHLDLDILAMRIDADLLEEEKDGEKEGEKEEEKEKHDGEKGDTSLLFS